MPPVLALGAVGALVFAGVSLFRKHADEQDRIAQFRAANGWSLDEVATQLTTGFDQDGDGRLAFDVVKGARMLGESVRTEVTKRWSEPLRVFGLPTGATAIREASATYTLEPTLRKADTDGDGVATRAEIAALLRSFDADSNGRLSTAEKGQALAALGGVYVSRDHKTVGIVPPPAKPESPAR